jgi:predicted permease
MDPSVLWIGAGLAIASALMLGFVPRLPAAAGAQGLSGGTNQRTTGIANRKLKAFALVQIAASFVLVAAAAAAVATLLSLEAQHANFETHRVLAINVPIVHDGRTPVQVANYYSDALRRIRVLPGVQNAAVGNRTPWRGGAIGLDFAIDGQAPKAGEKPAHATYEVVTPGFFASLGLALAAGRDFTDADAIGSERVAIVNETLAQRMFPNGDAVGHSVAWMDGMLRFAPGGAQKPSRIIGVAPDIQSGNASQQTIMAIYQPFAQQVASGFASGHLLVETRSDPYPVVQPITRILRNLNADQPVEEAGTLEDIRAEVLTPTRLDALVSGVFAAVALLVAVVGIAGVLTFSMSGRTREFGIRLAIGSQPRDLLLKVIREGVAMAFGGLAVGLVCGFVLARVAGSLLGGLKMPGLTPLIGSAVVLLVCAVTAAAIPAARAARVDVMQALRSE